MQNLEAYISTLLIVVAVATVLVNIIVEVLKKVTWDLIPTNLLAFIVAETITLLAFFAICQGPGHPGGVVHGGRGSGAGLDRSLCGYVRLR